METDDLKAEESKTHNQRRTQRRGRRKNVLLGVGALFLGLMMLGSFARMTHHRPYRGSFNHHAAEVVQGSDQTGATQSGDEFIERFEHNHDGRGEHRMRHGRGEGRNHHALFMPIKMLMRFASVALIFGGMALYWRRRNPDHAYTNNNVQQHMTQEFEEDDININPDA